MILWQLFWVFVKIGLFTVGGGYAMIPLIQQEIQNRGWLTTEGIIDIIAVSEMTPGPFAVNAATFIGIQTSGVTGAVLSTTGVIFPSFLIVILIAKYFTRVKDHPIIQGLLSGLRPAVIGLIAAAAMVIGEHAFLLKDGPGLMTSLNWRSLIIFAAALTGIIKYKVHPALMIVISAVLGILMFGLL